jgi:hypothetical protein
MDANSSYIILVVATDFTNGEVDVTHIEVAQDYVTKGDDGNKTEISGSSWDDDVESVLFKVYGSLLSPQNPAFYEDEGSCTDAGFYWYNGACHRFPESSGFGDGLVWIG